MEAPTYLKDRGRSIWEAYDTDAMSAVDRALIHELARLADALDKLDMILGARASDWAKIIIDEVGEVTLEVNGLLGERRQHAIAFKTLYAEVRAAKLVPRQVGKVQIPDEPEDMLAGLRAEKEKRERQSG